MTILPRGLPPPPTGIRPLLFSPANNDSTGLPESIPKSSPATPEHLRRHTYPSLLPLDPSTPQNGSNQQREEAPRVELGSILSIGETEGTDSTLTDGTIRVGEDGRAMEGISRDRLEERDEGERNFGIGVSFEVGDVRGEDVDSRGGTVRGHHDACLNASTSNSLKRGRSRTRTLLPDVIAGWERREREKERDGSFKKPKRAGSLSDPMGRDGGGDEVALERTQPMAIPKPNGDQVGLQWEPHSISLLGMTPMTGRQSENTLESCELDLLQQAAEAMTSRSLASGQGGGEGSHESDVPDNKRVTALGNIVISNRMASPRISPSALEVVGGSTPTKGSDRKGKQAVRPTRSREALSKRRSSERIGAHRQPLRSKSSLLNMTASAGRGGSPPPARPASALAFHSPPASAGKGSRKSPTQKHLARWSMSAAKGTTQTAGAKLPMKRRLTGKSIPSTAGQVTSVITRPNLGVAEMTFTGEPIIGLGGLVSAQISQRAVSDASVASLPDERLIVDGANPFEAEIKARKASALLKSIQDRDMEQMANLAVQGDYFSSNHTAGSVRTSKPSGMQTRAQRTMSLGSAKSSLGKALAADQRGGPQADDTSPYKYLGLMTPLDTIRRIQMRREISQGPPSPLLSAENGSRSRAMRSTSDYGQFVYTRSDGTTREITEQRHPFHYNYLVRRNSRSQGGDGMEVPIRGVRRDSERSFSDQEDMAAWRGFRSGSPRPSSRRPPPSAFRGSPRLPSHTMAVTPPMGPMEPPHDSAQPSASLLSTSLKSDSQHTPPAMGGPWSDRGTPAFQLEQSPAHLRMVSRSTSFDSRSAYEAVKKQDGYVSFEDVAGLAMQAGGVAENVG